MQGSNSLILCNAMLKHILERYLNDTLFSIDTPPVRVMFIKFDVDDASMTVEFEPQRHTNDDE